jgi:hypothetical protein
MTTTVAKIIKSSGGDYSTLAAWIAACPANLVTADQVWQGQVDGTITITSGTGCTIPSSITTDATRYVELTAKPGTSYLDNANIQTNAYCYNASNGSAITSSAAWTTIINTQAPYTRINKLQIAGTGAQVGPVITANTALGTVTIDQCILEQAKLAGGVVSLTVAGSKINNSLCVQRGSGAGCIVHLYSGATANNCTFVVPSDKTKATVGIESNYASATVSNCAIFGVTNVKSGSTTFTWTTCYSDATLTGVTTLTYNTAAFQNITDSTRDFRLPSGSGLIDVGTTDSTNGATDGAGTSRPQGSAYDVGSWEYKSSGPTLVQYFPGADISAGNWTPSTGTTLWGTVDESSASDSDYNVSGLNPSADVMEVKFAGVLTPSANTNHTISYKIKGDSSTNMTVALYCGATLIKSWSHSPAPSSFTRYDQTLSTGEASTITNYSDLRLRVTAG